MHPLWEARKDVLKSYGHKLLILIIAVVGYGTLGYLANQKKLVDDHKRKGWQISSDLLDDVKRLTPPETDDVIDKMSAQAPASVFDKIHPAMMFESREALTETLQQLAEAEVWRRYRSNVAEDLKQMRVLAAKKTDEAKEEFARRSDLVAREEAYVRAQALGIRQQIQAATAQLEPLPNKGQHKNWERWMATIADEKGHLFVIYEIAWYASLLFGVLATSYLFILLLTALPITSGEGYWTNRINKLLERVPSASLGGGGGTKSAAALVALLGGAAVAAPPMLATGPGGPVPPSAVDRRSYIDARTHATAAYSYELEREFPTIPNYDETLTTIQRSVNDLAQAAGETLVDVKNLEANVNTSREALNERIARLATMADVLECHIGAVDVKLAAAEEGIFATQQQTMYVEANHSQLVSALGKHETSSATTLTKIDKSQTVVSTTLDATVSQAAVRDPRGFWVRAFGPTYFQVSPMTPALIKARTQLSTTAGDLELLEAAVRQMSKDPMYRGKFEDELRKKLTEVVKAAVNEQQNARFSMSAIPAKVDEIIERELPVLLQLTSVPRT